jgi:hypothetical protein
MKAQEQTKQLSLPKASVGRGAVNLSGGGSEGKEGRRRGKKEKGDGHDRLLRNNLDGALDLDILVSDMVTRAEMNHPHQAY